MQGFYNYKNKYQAGSAVETCPAELPTEQSEAMQRAAEAVFEALRLETYARMDFLMEEDGTFYCLEANTLPGMTDTSLLPQEARAAGANAFISKPLFRFQLSCDGIIKRFGAGHPECCR